MELVYKWSTNVYILNLLHLLWGIQITDLPQIPNVDEIWTWILGLGGLIGWYYKTHQPQKREHRLQIRAARRKYEAPFIKAANSLDTKLALFIYNVEKEKYWYSSPEKGEYYQYTTLYAIGNYFGWCKILENEGYLEYVLSNKRARKFNKKFYRVHEGLSGQKYYQKQFSARTLYDIKIKREVLTAIGELMINENTTGDKFQTISFVEFVRRYEDKSTGFQRWFKDIDEFLKELEKKPLPSDIRWNIRWNQINVFALNLRLFVNDLKSETLLYPSSTDALHLMAYYFIRRRKKGRFPSGEWSKEIMGLNERQYPVNGYISNLSWTVKIRLIHEIWKEKDIKRLPKRELESIVANITEELHDPTQVTSYRRKWYQRSDWSYLNLFIDYIQYDKELSGLLDIRNIHGHKDILLWQKTYQGFRSKKRNIVKISNSFKKIISKIRRNRNRKRKKSKKKFIGPR